ncbi:alpha/beta fold hydrolase [Streptomyces sp. NBC_00576]|uniref:alpha/beta fold hydrolase n=1 Tax=Streptomyces sp. NBC_00576 TaxID=2903665 RepID=UPI002E8016FF|nr:alpha/beta fold hydrolase [Streptomyces sp. NBC_00576]WUB74123.1 alpha/beta hydrolase [Streptomyces sp. NBC_00576]
MAVTTTDHWVKHKSTVPATENEQVELFVRERDGTPPGSPTNRKAVLMLHGRSVPVLAGFDLQHTSYGWAEALAKAGYDVFMMDLTGSGRSPRPRMEDPCNVNPNQQVEVMPPLYGPRPPSYPYVLTNSQSDQDELSTVVEYIRSTRNVSKVAFIGWSAAAFAMGPYAIKNPGKVESLFLLAPIFPPLGPSNPPTLPAPGFPTHVLTRKSLDESWKAQVHCTNQREADILDVVWSALMDNDPIGRTWGKVQPNGKPAGVNRFRNFVTWGWNKTTAGQDGILGGGVPVLIVHGEFDTTANTTPPNPNPALDFHVPALYDAITGLNRILVTVKCAGHSMPWEGQHKNLHNLSKHWLKQLKVEGKTKGRFVMAEDGVITQAP